MRIGFWDTTDLTVIHPISRQEMSAPSDFVRFLLEVESFGDCLADLLGARWDDGDPGRLRLDERPNRSGSSHP